MRALIAEVPTSRIPALVRSEIVKLKTTAAVKSLQLCLTLCEPGCTVPGILQARTLERVAISFSNA